MYYYQSCVFGTAIMAQNQAEYGAIYIRFLLIFIAAYGAPDQDIGQFRDISFMILRWFAAVEYCKRK